MSSISLSTKTLFSAFACASLTLLACGDESKGGDDDDDVASDEGGDDSNDPTGQMKDGGRASLADASAGKDGGASQSEDDNVAKDAGKAGSKDAGKAGSKDAAASGDLPVELVQEGAPCDPAAYGGLGSIGGLCEGCGSDVCVATCDQGTYGPCQNVFDVIGGLAGDSGFDIGELLGDGGLSFDSDGGLSVPTSQCPAEYTCQQDPGFQIPGNTLVGSCLNQSGLPAACETTADCTAAGFELATCFDPTAIPELGSIFPVPQGYPAKYCTTLCSL